MRIGIAGPVMLAPFRHRFDGAAELPNTLSFPLVGHIVEELVRRGHSLTVFAGSTELSSPKQFQGDGVDLHVVPLRKKRAPYDFYRMERRALTNAMRHSSCEFIHAHWTYEFAAAALDSKKLALVTAHDSPPAILRYFILSRYAPFWTARSSLGVWVLRRAQRITTVSPYCRDSIQRWISPTAPISVVPNGIESEILEKGRKRLDDGPPAGPFTMATVLQGFQDRKNPKAALAALAILRRQCPGAELHMIGTGYESGGAAEAWARAQGLAAGVRFMGNVSHGELLRYLSDSVHLLVHPAKEESFGMAPLEAMSLGIPVVGGHSSGGVPYVLGGGEAGVLVDVSSPRRIADSVVQLLVHPEKMHNLTHSGWRRASREFTLERTTSLYEAEYAKLLGDSHES